MVPSTISGINQLPDKQKLEIYSRLIPPELVERFNLNHSFTDDAGNILLKLNCGSQSSDTEMKLYHKHGFQDPILYGHITDTIMGQIHILLYILNDPSSPRFDVDRMPDGTRTLFGVNCRNIKAEIEAMHYGLAPGQIRKGLRLLSPAIIGFEHFVDSLGHDLYYAEPLYYHNAYIFERYGFAYQQGKKLMQRIQDGFTPGGDLLNKLDNSTPFRKPEAALSIRLRSWAIHDGILGEPFTKVTMYKSVGKSAKINTSVDCKW